MRIELTPDSPESVHEQISQQFREAIHAGRLKAGDRLPAMRKLAAEIGVSFGTPRDAYEKLQAEGFVRVTATGVFVSDRAAGRDAERVACGLLSLRRTLIQLARAGASREDASAVLDAVFATVEQEGHRD